MNLGDITAHQNISQSTQFSDSIVQLVLADAGISEEVAPWLWIFPGLLIVLTVLSINFLGDGLRDALDPTIVT